MVYEHVNNSFKGQSSSFGGGKAVSIQIFITFYNIGGIIDWRISQPVYKHGFVLISMSQGTKFSSIIKSYP